MILLADSGSTKTAWALLKDGQACSRYYTSGINPFFQSESEIENQLRTDLLPHLGIKEFSEIHFYGAGCTTDIQKQLIRNAFSKVFDFDEIEIESDMLEAARALCGNERGIACILGTGSNSCYYDGKIIAKSVPSLGYIVGDEGGGVSLGRRLVADCLKNQLNESLKKKFFKRFGLTEEQIMDTIYHKPFPNRFLASFTVFLKENLEDPKVYSIVYDGFTDFFKRNVFQYDYQNLSVHVAGSVGFHFVEVLQKVASDLSVKLGKVVQDPMEGLIQYYNERNQK